MVVNKRANGGVVAVVLTYAGFASLWILVSDRALGLLVSDPQALVRASMLKGWLFVAVTSLLLYGLVRRLTVALEQAHRRELAFERERDKPPPMLMAIADASPDCIYAKDMEGRYVMLNRSAAQVLGREVDALVGRTNEAVFPPAQAEHLSRIDQRVRTLGQPETTEETFHTASGEARCILVTKGPLRDPDGKVFGTFGVSRDITAAKQAQNDLQALADDLSATLHAIPDLLFELDAQGRYTRVRAMNADLLAAPTDELLGRTVGEVLPPDAAAVVMQALAAAGHAGADLGRTYRLPLPSGERHFELSVARKPALAGQEQRFVVLSRDITERHAAENELRLRNQELERFNRAAIERELRMVELKREVNAMARAAGWPPPYDTSFAEVPAVDAAP